MYNLALAFKDKGLDVHYLSLTPNQEHVDEINKGIMIHWIKKKKSFFSWIDEMRVCQNILDRIQPDILYQRGRVYLTYTAAQWSQKNGKKFIWGTNGENSCEFWKNIRIVKKSQKSLWRKLLLYPYMAIQDRLIHRGIQGADQVVNQTDHQKNQLKKNFGKEGIVLPSYFLPPSLKSPKKEKIVLWLASLTRNKQPELFLKFVEHNQDINWKFILGGGTKDKKYWHKLSRQAAQLKHLEMIGPVPFEETHHYYAQASLFVSTSLNEGISNTFVQAWLNRTPVLSFSQDPNGWIEKYHLGYCAHNDVKDFLRQGRAFLEKQERLENQQESCVQFANKTFAAQEIIDTYIDIFKNS